MSTVPRLFYIAGWGRSGSTLIADILGAVPGVFDAGELRQFWKRMGREDHACGCGEPVAACPFWRDVLREIQADREMPTTDIVEIRELQREATRVRNTGRVVRATGESELAMAPFPEYIAAMRGLFRAVSRVSGDGIIVDSSKGISYGALARIASNNRFFLIHLVRDPRATAYSWQRHMARGPSSDRQMALLSPHRSSINWDLYNIGAAMLRRRMGRAAMLVRYEDFVAAPRDTLAPLLTVVPAGAPGSPFIDGRTVDLPPNHAFAGNPSRFRDGTVSISSDDEWIYGQSKRDRLLTTLITSPLLRSYDYPLRVRESTHER